MWVRGQESVICVIPSCLVSVRITAGKLFTYKKLIKRNISCIRVKEKQHAVVCFVHCVE
jgi:hypothetical protein